MSACRSCGAAVRWVPTGKTKSDGKPVLQILDAEPAKGVVLTHPGTGLVLADQITADAGLVVARVVDVYTDHHATCSHADEWKGRQR